MKGLGNESKSFDHDSQRKCEQGPDQGGSHGNAIGLLMNDIIEAKFNRACRHFHDSMIS